MRGIKSNLLVAIIDFLYQGEANVLQDDLDSFLALAEEFKLRGLTGNSQSDEEQQQEVPKNSHHSLKREIGQQSVHQNDQSQIQTKKSNILMARMTKRLPWLIAGPVLSFKI